MTEQLVETQPAPGVVLLTLNRPEQRNALDAVLIEQLLAVVGRLGSDASCRVILLTGAGSAFCAGADLQAMRALGRGDAGANLADAERLAQLLLALHQSPKPTLALVNGPAFGGGVGLVAACDIALGSEQARFRLPEVQLGVVPAVISPYVLAAIGRRASQRLCLTAEPVSAVQARELGLLHEVVPAESLLSTALTIAAELCKAGPRALAECKALLQSVAARQIDATLARDTASVIARLRRDAEGQEGLSAAIERRPPRWPR